MTDCAEPAMTVSQKAESQAARFDAATMADMDAIMAIAERHGARVVLDEAAFNGSGGLGGLRARVIFAAEAKA